MAYSPWGGRESDMTEQLNNKNNNKALEICGGSGERMSFEKFGARSYFMENSSNYQMFVLKQFLLMPSQNIFHKEIYLMIHYIQS